MMLLRYGTFPLMVLGFMGAIVFLVGAHAPLWQPFAVFGLAILTMLAIERAIPYQPQWNHSRGDAVRDLLHGFVNTVASHGGIFLLPLLAGIAPFPHLWPHSWPFWAQVVAAIVVLDLGIAFAHHMSHKVEALWRFHAVHHSVKRLYGFNGLMKHPVHQAIETGSGIAPLLLIGIPTDVGIAVAFCVAIQLLLQHSNADYRTGPLKYLFAHAEVHRFHHARGGKEGDVNFGLFTTLYDHLFGTYYHRPGLAPRDSEAIGIAGEDDYPAGYVAQLLKPFSDVFGGHRRSAGKPVRLG